jgi:hypothetical protein
MKPYRNVNSAYYSGEKSSVSSGQEIWCAYRHHHNCFPKGKVAAAAKKFTYKLTSMTFKTIFMDSLENTFK